ncbi:MAG: glycosyltransferase family 2 protein [Planctomycetota bacterium]
MPQPTIPVTVCIPVLNEERNLPRCLEALGDSFAEIVVVDSGSRDRTREIATAAGATVLEFHWNGSFPKKRNWFLRNHTFTTPWVLFLDADELVTPAFLEELRAALPTGDRVGYWISFNNWFMGKPLRHGDIFRKLALIRHGSGEYERFPEQWWSHLDMEVHEHPVLEGPIGELKARLEHHDFRGIEHSIDKHNQYSTWEANRFLWLREAGPEHWTQLTTRQRFKYRYLDRFWLGWAYFLVGYIAKRGFLDGRVGWTFAAMKMRYFQDVRLKIRERLAERSGKV